MSIETQAATIPIPTADLPATTSIINNNNVNQSNSNSTSPSKARRRRKRNNKNKNKNKNTNANQANINKNKTNQNTDSTKDSKSNTKSNKKKQQKPKQTVNTNANSQPMDTKLDRVQLLNKGKKNPWANKQQSSAFENIMSEQEQTKKPNYNHIQPQMDEQQLLEQQMIAMAIAASKKEQQEAQLTEYQKYSKTDNEATNKQNGNDDEKQMQDITANDNIKNEDEEKQIIEDNASKPSINDELIAATINAQSNMNPNVKIGDETMSDEALAIQLQQQEQREYNRRQKMSQIYDGKYAKVTSSAVRPTAVPKAALNFYYDDKSMLNGGLTKEQYQQHLMTTQASEESIVDENGTGDNTESVAATEQTQDMEEELEAISKHDAKIWSEKHMERLNEYEVGGNLNMNMNIGNQAYNSFRNQLDKKHFITYHNYQLEPSDRKR